MKFWTWFRLSLSEMLCPRGWHVVRKYRPRVKKADGMGEK